MFFIRRLLNDVSYLLIKKYFCRPEAISTYVSNTVFNIFFIFYKEYKIMSITDRKNRDFPQETETLLVSLGVPTVPTTAVTSRINWWLSCSHQFIHYKFFGNLSKYCLEGLDSWIINCVTRLFHSFYNI